MAQVYITLNFNTSLRVLDDQRLKSPSLAPEMNFWFSVSEGGAGKTIKEQGRPEQRTITEKVNWKEFELLVGWD